ncbi:MAG: S8 family peptidase [Candidatus Aenigmarchaeota archaeon]|nr:S8 family peptidase [Candidatus Aenigmarchaeota archaeon]
MKMKTKSYWLITILVLTIFAVSGIAAAAGIDKGSAEVMPSGKWVEAPQAIGSSSDRVIAPTTSFIDKTIFRMKGCKILHELNDATALKCPPGVAIKDARPDRIFHILDMEADVQIGADDVWAQGILGTGVNVAVLDTGIDMNHPELNYSYIDGYDYVDNDNIPEDWHGHGTHVSGIITADGVNADAKGVAPGAGIYMYKVCGTNGCYESDMIAAMDAAVLTDAKVMSISIGGGNFAGENCDSDPLAAKVNEVVSQGITVVVASGNDRFFVSSPACASGAIAVGAVDKTGLMASFSNFGPALDIVAPGVDIYSSLIGGYDSWSGTSMSTPHVSGTVALMLDANPDLNVDDIKTALYETADPINQESICYGVVRQRGSNYWIGVVPCTSDHSGAGLVDAYGAVNYYAPQEPECTEDIDCQSDGYYETGNTQWLSTGQCTEKEQKEEEYRDYFCSASQQCEYSITYTHWVDTAATRDKQDGTVCEFDGYWCTKYVCLSGSCVYSKDTCDDEIDCTIDFCDESEQTCSYDDSNCLSEPYCGDGTKDEGEECDGSDLDTKTCQDWLGYDSGTLSCNLDCTYNIDSCTFCGGCLNSVCDGKCHPRKENGDTCSDCW